MTIQLPNLIGQVGFAKVLGWDYSRFRTRREWGGIPEPAYVVDRRRYWTEDQVAEFVRYTEASRLGFDNRVRELRRERGWSQAELAERAEVSELTVFHLEHGITVRPRRSTMKKVAKGFELETADVFWPKGLASSPGTRPTR